MWYISKIGVALDQIKRVLSNGEDQIGVEVGGKENGGSIALVSCARSVCVLE